MNFFSEMQSLRYGDVHLRTDETSGLRAIIAIHNTNLGPAIGGCRCLPYGSDVAALVDALRLARAMGYKAAISGLPHGGGKSVIMAPEGDFDRDVLFEAFGAFVESIGGRYITCEDSGTSPDDMDRIARATDHVLGTSSGSGDPSGSTALGVRRGIEAAAKFHLGRSDLEGLKVAIQGVGHVGFLLARELSALGCELVVADVSRPRVQRAVDELGAQASTPDEILFTECDVLAPCALGGALNIETIPRIQAKIVAGAANNQLARPKDGLLLHKRGILYAPDFAVNAGGLIQMALELESATPERVREQVDTIGDVIFEIFDRARSTDTLTHQVAEAMAEERIYGSSD